MTVDENDPVTENTPISAFNLQDAQKEFQEFLAEWQKEHQISSGLLIVLMQTELTNIMGGFVDGMNQLMFELNKRIKGLENPETASDSESAH